MRLQKVYFHDRIERVTHWVHLLNTVLLMLSGFQIAYPAFNVFGSMNAARWVHFVDAYLFLFIGVFHIYQFFAAGKWPTAGPTRRNMRGFGRTIKYYFFLSRERPHERKYNPLQIVAYLILFVISALIVITGFTLYWPQPLWTVREAFGGIMTLRQVHYILAVIMGVFTLVHIYLVATQPWAVTKSMVTGTYWRRAEDAYPVPVKEAPAGADSGVGRAD